MTRRTRIKICGLTREEDVAAAVQAGADAIGFVFYPKSPRYVTAQRAAELAATVPPFVSTVGLFVNPTVDEVRAVLAAAPLTLLQFHGDETPQQCAEIAAAVVRPFMRAARIGSATRPDDLLEYELQYRSASPFFNGLLLDTLVEQYGGSGKAFDWSVIPKELAPRAVLSGGLSVHNATEAVAGVRPYAVDISSGVEASKGIKDAAKISAFIGAVRLADATQA
ncbi:phosphoribosylanthranilate isomerase [Herbaspirillum robiniae]|uniref:N-(5'-phosphoribosyl)anthranilate isomerase n=2 Tax=Herbaspirillum robiniae TaxID=2014887 RepID=A0A246WWQ3_9BURK|nr:phosphoribosylanthranilate isomerase [Herbaspirillum robiniae]NUU01205.1 phosphoribosylanthranilate isomerase [Herbaspirillum robiniae]OWY31495.1 phosphoribosylanthranilate isomerase [Herbaspirillum robiniae]